MAITVFDQQVATAATKVIEANLNIFNTASRGALVMGAGDFLGDYLEKTFWAAQQMVNRRNAYGTGKVTATELAQILERAIKVDQRIGPLEVTPAIMDRLGKNPEEAAAVMAEQVAGQMVQDYIDVATGALLAATPTEMVYDFASLGVTVPKIKQLVKGTRLLGDKAQRIVAYVMSGATYNDILTEDVLTNVEKLYTIGEVNVMSDGLGRVFVVTDAPALDGATGSGASAKNYQNVLALTAGAAVIQTANPLKMYSNDILGYENIQLLMQGEANFNLALKGYSYIGKSGALGKGDKATSPTPAAEQKADQTGSASPSNDTLFAKTSWGITDNRGVANLDVKKGLAGVVVKFGDQ